MAIKYVNNDLSFLMAAIAFAWFKNVLRVICFQGPPSLLATRRKYSKIGSMATLECSVSTRVTKPTNMYWRHNELKFEEGQFVNKLVLIKFLIVDELLMKTKTVTKTNIAGTLEI